MGDGVERPEVEVPELEGASEPRAPERPEAGKVAPWAVVLVALLMVASAVGVFCLVRWLREGRAPESGAVDETVLFLAEDLPRVDASLATQPLVDAFLKNFTGRSAAELGVEYSNTHPAYVGLIEGEKDLIVVTEPSEEELALAAEKGVELQVTKVVNEGFTFFVNRENPVTNLSSSDLVKIYTGEVTNWRDLGGRDAEIIAYQRPANSGSQTALENLVLKGQEVKIPTIKESVTLSMAGIIDYVASYDNAADAIGFGFFYYVNTMYKNDRLKYLSIDGISLTYATIQDETYPLLSAYYIVTRKDDETEAVKQLKVAMLSPRGQYVASEAGYVPVK